MRMGYFIISTFTIFFLVASVRIGQLEGLASLDFKIALFAVLIQGPFLLIMRYGYAIANRKPEEEK